MRTLTPVAVALVVVLAGCSGLPLPGSESDRVSVTPADVPNRAGSEAMPPGVTETGIVDPIRLIDAHRGVVANETLTVTERWQTVSPNGTELSRVNTTYRFSANRTLTLVETTGNSTTESDIQQSIWQNDTTRYRLSHSDGMTAYERRPQADLQSFMYDKFQERVRSVENGTVTTNDSAPPRYRLNGSLKVENGPSVRGNNTARSDGYLTASIDSEGFVHRYEYGWLSKQNGTLARTTVVVRFHANTTPPERPEWVSKAVNATKNETPELESGTER